MHYQEYAETFWHKPNWNKKRVRNSEWYAVVRKDPINIVHLAPCRHTARWQDGRSRTMRV